MRQLRMYGGGVLLIVAGVAFSVVLLLAPAAGASGHDGAAGARRDFDRMVEEIGEHYHVQPKNVPMMGLVNLCARMATRGGVGAMKVVQFYDESGAVNHFVDADQEEGLGFAAVVRNGLGDHWTQVVRQRDESGTESLIFVQNDADDLRQTRLIVMNLDPNELNVVALSLDPAQLERWMNEQESQHGWWHVGRGQGVHASDGAAESVGE